MSEEQPQTEPTVEPDFEELAAQDGWQPQANWKGPADRWVDAKTFVERGAQILPIVQAKNRKLYETVASLERTVGELKEGNSLFREHHERVIARELQEKQDLLSQLEAQRAKAITDGDGQTFSQADRKLQELRSQTPVAAKPQLPAETQAWLADNAWYNSDPALQAMADGLSELLKRENPTLKGRAFLDKLTERVQAEVPQKFENSRRRETVTGENARKASTTKARTFDDLPQDAKDAYEVFAKTIPGFKKDTYLKTYRWD